MVFKRPLPEFGVEIVCSNRSLRVFDAQGNLVEEEEVNVRTYVEASKAVGQMEDALPEK